MIMPSERMITPVPSSWLCAVVTVIDTVLGCTAWAIAATPVADLLDAGFTAVGLAYVVPLSPMTAATAPPARPPPRISASARPPAATLRLGVHQAGPPGGVVP